jgi:membrane carboxypeptidase/penicillin-binding protein PbpC
MDRFLDLAEALGITTLRNRQRYDLSLTLGGGEVTLLELTGAYAVFATGGLRQEPASILRVEDSTGQVLYEWQPPAPQRVLDERVAYLITDILSDNSARTPAFGDASALLLSRPAAAKTGTTTDWRDNWTVGYTPDLVAGVWVGNSDNRPMRRVSGVSGAGPIWHDFMEAALRTAPPRSFVRPDGLVEAEVCSPMGQLPGPYCQETRRELFIAGTEPTELDTYYQPLSICLATGNVADQSCPPGQTAERVFAFPPPEAIPWARDAGLLLPPVPPYRYGPDPLESPAAAGEASPPAVQLVGAEDGLVLRWSPELPPNAQALPLEAVVSGLSASSVRLLDNGRLVSESGGPPFRFLWPLTEGQHNLQALARTVDGGEVAAEPVTLTVEPP